VNYRAMAALTIGVALALTGRFVSTLHWLYDYAWFTGFFVSGGLYILLMQTVRSKAASGSLVGEEA
jgi:nucleobase:cation symporter-1, NCS1 family